MKSIIQIEVSLEDGVYTAGGVNAPIVTEGATFEELQENIRDAVALYPSWRGCAAANEMPAAPAVLSCPSGASEAPSQRQSDRFAIFCQSIAIVR